MNAAAATVAAAANPVNRRDVRDRAEDDIGASRAAAGTAHIRKNAMFLALRSASRAASAVLTANVAASRFLSLARCLNPMMMSAASAAQNGQSPGFVMSGARHSLTLYCFRRSSDAGISHHR